VARSDRPTKQQELFLAEVIKTGNQRAAYRTAYPASRKWNDASVDTEASRLLSNPKVSPRYEELRARLAREAEEDGIVSAKAVLRELKKVAFADIADFAIVEENCVSIVDTMSIPAEKRGAIAGIKESANGVEVKLNDKMKALELLGKHLGMFEQKPMPETPESNDGFLDALQEQAGDVWDK